MFIIHQSSEWIPDNTSQETSYEYDSDGHLIKTTLSYDNVAFEVTAYDYRNGLLMSTVTRSPGSTSGFRIDNYYSGNLIDSTVSYRYSESGIEQYGRFTSKYVYDDQNRLIRKGWETYKYDASDRVISVCDDYSSCYESEYNSAGQLSKYYLVYNYTERKEYLMDEYIYINGRLEEKKSYNWFYLLQPGPGPDVFVRKYEY